MYFKMFLIKNRKIFRASFRIGNYYVKVDESTFVHKSSNHLFVFEGYLYPDALYSRQDILTHFKNMKSTVGFKKFKGKFCGSFIDLPNNTICIFNDQLGTKNLYYSCSQNPFEISISNSFSQIISSEDFSASDVDFESLKEFLSFEFPLGHNTFIKSVKSLPLASIYFLSPQKVRKLHYWKYKIKEQKRFNTENALKQIDFLLNQSMNRIISTHGKNKKYSLGLSGGFDSRLVAHYAKKNNVSLNTFILGEPNSDACLIANQISNLLQLKLVVLGFNCDFMSVARKMIKHNPMMNVLYGWYYQSAKGLSKYDVLLTGYLGGEIFGSHIKSSDVVHESIPKLIATRFNQNKQLNLRTSKRLNKVVSELNSHSTINKVLEFDYTQRQLKFIKDNPAFHFFREQPMESIFEDIDLIEYVLTIPAFWKLDMKLYQLFFKKYLPLLAKIRGERRTTGSSRVADITLRVIRYLDIKVLKINLIFKPSHKNFPKWLRGDINFFLRCSKILNTKNELFDENFSKYHPEQLLNKILQGKANEKNITFLLLLISIKLFFDTHLAKIRR